MQCPEEGDLNERGRSPHMSRLYNILVEKPSPSISQNLHGDYDEPNGHNSDVSMVKGFDNINNSHGIGRSIAKSVAHICKDCNDNMLFHIKGLGIQ